MRIRKFAALILAMVVAASLSVSAFASIGGYASSPRASTATAANPAPATSAQITSSTAAAINKADGGQATVSLVNVSTVSVSAIKDAFAQADTAGLSAVVQLDAREGGVVLSRIYIDAATAEKLSGTVDFSVSTKGAAVTSAVNKFEKYFDNKVAAVSLGQKGAFGADIKMAAKVDLSGLDTASLVFYAYDKGTGKYTKLRTGYKIDSNGYLHFTTPVGGDIIISDKPLARK